MELVALIDRLALELKVVWRQSTEWPECRAKARWKGLIVAELWDVIQENNVW